MKFFQETITDLSRENFYSSICKIENFDGISFDIFTKIQSKLDEFKIKINYRDVVQKYSFGFRRYFEMAFAINNINYSIRIYYSYKDYSNSKSKYYINLVPIVDEIICSIHSIIKSIEKDITEGKFGGFV